MSYLKELLTKLGYSEYALESEIVTEDLLDEMDFEDGPLCYLTNKLYKDGNANVECKSPADNKSFDMKPTTVDSCN